MLSALHKGFWRKAGVALSLFAAVCFALPPAVLAMGHGANTVSCLSHADRVDHGLHYAGHADHRATQDAARGASAVKDQGGHAPSGGDRQMTCCGLYCVSAVAPADNRIATPPILGVQHTMAPGQRLISRTPQLPEHPPKPRFSV